MLEESLVTRERMLLSGISHRLSCALTMHITIVFHKEQFCLLLCDWHALSCLPMKNYSQPAQAISVITNAIGRFYVNRPKRAKSHMSRVLSDFSGSCQKDVAPRYCSQEQPVLFNTSALSTHMISIQTERVHLPFHHKIFWIDVVLLAKL